MRRAFTGWLLALALTWAAVIAAEPLFRALAFDLRSVIVTKNEACPEPLCIVVDRVIQRDIELVWWVTAHRSDTGGKVYGTPVSGAGPYTRAAYEANPVLHRSLAWWIGGQSRLDDAALEPGRRYFIRTCHALPPLNWPRGCAESNVFTVAAIEGGE